MVRHFSNLFILWLSLAAVRGAAAEKPQPPDDQRISELISELDSNRYLVREEATQSLLTAGPPALDQLLATANGDRPEPADRAVWILRKLSETNDRAAALAALDRLVEVKNRPNVVAEARLAQSRLREIACQEALAELGAQMTVIETVLAEVGPIRLVRVEFNDSWNGTAADLHCLLELDQHQYFRLVGSAVDNEIVKLFEAKDGLVLLQIFNSRVTPDAIDAIKVRQPRATLYVRNRALLGIQSDTRVGGIRVMSDPDASTGAGIAGIKAGDVITKIDGKELPDFDRLTAQVAQRSPGDKVEVTIVRGDETLTKQVTLGDRAPEP